MALHLISGPQGSSFATAKGTFLVGPTLLEVSLDEVTSMDPSVQVEVIERIPGSGGFTVGGLAVAAAGGWLARQVTEGKHG